MALYQSRTWLSSQLILVCPDKMTNHFMLKDLGSILRF